MGATSYKAIWTTAPKTVRSQSIRRPTHSARIRTPSGADAWYVWSGQRMALKAEGYARDCNKEGCSYGFLASNEKATNDYGGVASMAYPSNVLYRPLVKGYCKGLGVTVSNEPFALSQLVQWV